MNASRKPLVYIISAPSGSGKSTLTNELLKLVPNLEFSISYTTRAPRGSEQNGKQYHFVPMDEFRRMVAAGYGDDHTENPGQRHRDGEGDSDASQPSIRTATLPRGPLPGRHAIHLHFDYG